MKRTGTVAVTCRTLLWAVFVGCAATTAATGGAPTAGSTRPAPDRPAASSAGNAGTRDPGTVLAAARADVERARHDLAEATRRIAEERSALNRRLRELQGALDDLRRQMQEARRTELSLHERRSAADEEESRLREEAETAGGLIEEFRRAFEMHLSPAWSIRAAAGLARIDGVLAERDVRKRLRATPLLFDLVRKFALERTGGCRFRGQAVAPDGKVVSGWYLETGPNEFFTLDQPLQCAGPTVLRPGSALPSVVDAFSREDKENLGRLIRGDKGVLPLDPTGGSAVRLREAQEPWWRRIEKGGIVMIPILALGLFCAILAVIKIVSLQRFRVRNAEEEIDAILAALRVGDVRRALALARELRRPLGPVVIEGIEHKDAPREHIEELMYERLLAQAPDIEKYLAALAVGASAAPLLGLLGTVTGMIHTFRLITVFGTGNPRVLASGIAEALITTEFGLIIAIPALLIHAWLSRRVRRTMTLTQQAAARFVNGLAAGAGGRGGSHLGERSAEQDGTAPPAGETGAQEADGTPG